MNYWNQAPLFRLLPAFVLGILLRIFQIPIDAFTGSAFVVICISIILVNAWKSKRYYHYQYRWVFGFATHVLVLAFAFILTGIKTEINHPQHFSHVGHGESFIAFLDNNKLEKSKSYKSILRIVAVKSGNQWHAVNGKCLTYISKDSISAKLSYGDLIVFNKQPIEVPPPPNPSQFNYKRYLHYNQVYHQVYLNASAWHPVAHHQGNSVVEMALKMREKLLKIFKDNHINGDDYAVLAALLLGDTDEIDQEIMRAYAASGALHVLSVSGLHVGIIYLGLNAALFFLNRNRKAKILKAGILILFLWYYALLTGLSPAVLRASAMLSFIVIGKALERSTNMYNTLAASAIVLLCFQPYLLMQVGFQLSYLAVLGIVFLYKKIHQLLNPSNWLLRQIWGITAVSLAAQLTTFPLGLFYFHQFPNYFLISNLLVIPVSTAIIYGGILLFFISPLTELAVWIGWILGKIVHFLNWFVISIEHLPYALLQGISISMPETGLIYFALMMTILYCMKKQTAYVSATLILIVCFLFLQTIESTQIRNQQQLIVHSIPKTTAINLIEGKTAIMVADSAFVHSKSMMAFNVLPYWWDSGVDEKNVSIIEVDQLRRTFKKNRATMVYKSFLQSGGKSIFVLNDIELLTAYSTSPLSIDYLILSGNISIKITDLLKKFRFKKLILDSSNSIYRTERWLKEASELGIDCYSVQHSGAFIKKF